MASKKRRKPAARPVAPRPAVTPGTDPVASTAPAAPSSRAQPRDRVPQGVDARDIPWTTTGMLSLLALGFLVQIPVGAIIHLTSNVNPLIIDMFFLQPQYLVLACVVVMPLARRLSGQARNLRLLESLSLGIMYALLALMVSTVFVHPDNGSVATDQFIRNLKLGDGLKLALSDVLALAGTVALYPGFSRLLGAPGRRARARMLERAGGGPAARKPGTRSSEGRVKPKR